MKFNCPREPCGIDGCKRRHLLHNYSRNRIHPSKGKGKATKAQGSKEKQIVANILPGRESEVLLKVLSIEPEGLKGEEITAALLDEGSTVKMIDLKDCRIKLELTTPSMDFSTGCVAVKNKRSNSLF